MCLEEGLATVVPNILWKNYQAIDFAPKKYFVHCMWRNPNHQTKISFLVFVQYLRWALEPLL